MHTGISTGLIGTDITDIDRVRHGITGGTIILASRLFDLARAGEILVGPDTYQQIVGHFDFETLGHTKVKGNDVTFLYNH
jgi:class 3 adenylate cyclase